MRHGTLLLLPGGMKRSAWRRRISSLFGVFHHEAGWERRVRALPLLTATKWPSGQLGQMRWTDLRRVGGSSAELRSVEGAI